MKLGCFQSNRGLREMAYADFVTGALALGYEAFDVPPNDADAVALVRDQGATVYATSAVVPPDLSKDAARQQEIVDVRSRRPSILQRRNKSA